MVNDTVLEPKDLPLLQDEPPAPPGLDELPCGAAPARRAAAGFGSGRSHGPPPLVEVGGGAVYEELRAKREAQRAAMEAREEQRKFNRLTAQEQAKYRAAGKEASLAHT